MTGNSTQPIPSNSLISALERTCRYPVARSVTQRRKGAQDARHALDTYRHDPGIDYPQATVSLLRAIAAAERALYLQTGGRMGAEYANVRSVARAYGLNV